jgi:hypothetical protein
MKAIIRTLDPDGVAVDFQTEEMKLQQLIALLPQVKEHLAAAGYELIDSHPAQVVEAAPPAAASQPTFMVEKIVATVDAEAGKTYWRVKGAEFQKFGVIIYPEVLEAAGLKLDPLKVFSEAGWMAVYSLKENGTPKKVTRLYRA